MKRQMILLSLVVIILPILSLGAVPLGEPFTLGVGEIVEVGGGGLVIGFNSIPADSRCPMEAFCVWEGNAEAALWLSLPIGNVEYFSLHTTLDPQVHVHDIFRVELLWVAPYPTVGVPIPPAAYEVMLAVVQIDVTENEDTTWSTVKSLYR